MLWHCVSRRPAGRSRISFPQPGRSQQRRSGAALSSALEHSLSDHRPPPTNTKHQAAAATGDDGRRRPRDHAHPTPRVGLLLSQIFVPADEPFVTDMCDACSVLSLPFPALYTVRCVSAMPWVKHKPLYSWLGWISTIRSVGPGFQGAAAWKTPSGIVRVRKWPAGIAARAFVAQKTEQLRSYKVLCCTVFDTLIP